MPLGGGLGVIHLQPPLSISLWEINCAANQFIELSLNQMLVAVLDYTADGDDDDDTKS